MRSAELKNETATNDRMVGRRMRRMAAIATLLLLVSLSATFALGSWAAFKMAGNQAMVMGDIVMTEDEVNPVISRLQQGGVEQTALQDEFGEGVGNVGLRNTTL